jgi:hypothetical protein
MSVDGAWPRFGGQAGVGHGGPVLRGWRPGPAVPAGVDQRREQAAVSIFVVAIIAEQPAQVRRRPVVLAPGSTGLSQLR